jgi:hypothetical protein
MVFLKRGKVVVKVPLKLNGLTDGLISCLIRKNRDLKAFVRLGT